MSKYRFPQITLAAVIECMQKSYTCFETNPDKWRSENYDKHIHGAAAAARCRPLPPSAALCCPLPPSAALRHGSFQSHKTVQIETYTSLFGGTFFYNRTDPVFFRASARKQKTKIRHTEPGRFDGHQRLWLFLLPGGRLHRRVFTEPWAMPPTAGTMKIERGVVYNPTIHHSYLLDKNRHPGCHQPWPLPPPKVPLRPFGSRAHVDRAMGDAPYRRRHENRAGGCV